MHKFISLVFLILAFSPLSFSQISLTNRGTSVYRIVIPQEASEDVKTGATDLQRYLREISGATLPIVNDATRAQAKEIVLGNTNRRRIDTQRLKEDGFVIQTHAQKVYLVGMNDEGTMYAAYHLLEKYLRCRFYSTRFKLIPKNANLRLPNINEKQEPAFTFREVMYRESLDSAEYRRWHRLDRHAGETTGLFVHTFNTLVPPAKHFDAHPEYFAEINGRRQSTQLCLTNENVLSETISELQKRMEQKPKAQFWSVSQNDNEQFCRCEHCSKLDAAEGAHSASVLQFTNQVAAKFPDKTISTLAYQYSRSVPKTTHPAPNVNIMLTSIECDRSAPLTAKCKDFVEDVRNWGKRTNNIFLWDYVVQFNNLISPFPNLRVLQPNLQFMRDAGLSMMFQQANREIGGEFADLRGYLIAKLMWNPDADVNALMSAFLRDHYGKAAPIIRQYIDKMHDELEKSGQRLDIFAGPTSHLDGYLSPQNMDFYAQLFDQAENTVRNEPETLERVKIARLPLEYAFLEQGKYYGSTARGLFEKTPDGKTHAKSEMRQKLLDFVALCKKIGVTRLHEWETTPDEYEVGMLLWLDRGVQYHLGLEKPVSAQILPSVKYQKGNVQLLTDGILGSTDFRYNWLGWEGDNMEVTLDLGETKPVWTVTTQFLQETRSWIFMPLSVSVEISEDGKTFVPVGKMQNTIDERDEKITIQPFEIRFAPRLARYVRVFARNRAEPPNWHAGAGGKSWIFVDEIAIK